MSDHTNREDFLNAIAEKAGRPRHQLKDHPFEPLNDLPETTLSGHSQDELETIAKKNSEGVHVTFKTTTKADLAAALDAYIEQDAPKTMILPTTDKYVDFGLTEWTNTVSPKPMYWTPGKGRDFNLKQAAAADVAIGFADYLLAESGTITVATTLAKAVASTSCQPITWLLSKRATSCHVLAKPWITMMLTLKPASSKPATSTLSPAHPTLATSK